MRKDIPEELYNYNKYPGLKFTFKDENIVAEDYHLQLVKNHKDAFDMTSFNQRFSELLLKYDFIVGDWSNDQLRLKGFYKDEQSGNKLNFIQRLDDYLNEYCSFGCAYFILQNLFPVELQFEEEQLYSKKMPRTSKKRQPSKRSQRQIVNFEKRSNRSSRDKAQKDKKTHHKKEDKMTGHFVIRQKGQ